MGSSKRGGAWPSAVPLHQFSAVLVAAICVTLPGVYLLPSPKVQSPSLQQPTTPPSTPLLCIKAAQIGAGRRWVFEPLVCHLHCLLAFWIKCLFLVPSRTNLNLVSLLTGPGPATTHWLIYRRKSSLDLGMCVPNSFHSNPKERQCQRMLKLPHQCTHLTR